MVTLLKIKSKRRKRILIGLFVLLILLGGFVWYGIENSTESSNNGTGGGLAWFNQFELPAVNVSGYINKDANFYENGFIPISSLIKHLSKWGDGIHYQSRPLTNKNSLDFMNVSIFNTGTKASPFYGAVVLAEYYKGYCVEFLSSFPGSKVVNPALWGKNYPYIDPYKTPIEPASTVQGDGTYIPNNGKCIGSNKAPSWLLLKQLY